MKNDSGFVAENFSCVFISGWKDFGYGELPTKDSQKHMCTTQYITQVH